jgi:hypothetical protein
MVKRRRIKPNTGGSVSPEKVLLLRDDSISIPTMAESRFPKLDRSEITHSKKVDIADPSKYIKQRKWMD